MKRFQNEQLDFKTNYVLDLQQTFISNIFSITLLLLLFIGSFQLLSYIATLPEYAKVISLVAFLTVLLPQMLIRLNFQTHYKLRNDSLGE